MREHNNRKKADALAEFITSKSLRKLVANKVHEYLGDRQVTVFDGAVGSGQLEEFIKLKHLVGIDIQQESIEALMHNFGDSCTGIVGDFFRVESDVGGFFDCVVMNPPFSLKCTESMASMPYYKKSGNLDECFYVLSSKKARFSFFVCFPGIGYRRTEQKMRDYFGNNVAEIITVSSAFEDTSIDVLLVVIDKNKKSQKVSVSLYSCKDNEYKVHPHDEILDITNWNKAVIEVEREKIDIISLTNEVNELSRKNRMALDSFDELVRSMMTEDELKQIK